MSNSDKTSADKIVEKYFDEICHHSEKGKLCRDLQTVWAEPMAIKLAILEVEACIAEMVLLGDKVGGIHIGYYDEDRIKELELIKSELKSRIV